MRAKDAAGEMAAYVRAVEMGGFSAAAREMGLTPSALSKLVTRLEDRLGVRLLNRSTRRLVLTPEGEAYFQRSRQILAEIEEAEAEVSRTGAGPRGRLRVSVGAAFGNHQLVPALPRFLARYPEVKLELSVSDRQVDLVEEGVDLAIRAAEMADDRLIARRICYLERTICAAPAYLAQHGTPRSPDELRGHNCLTISTQPALRRWPFDTAEGQRVIEVGGSVATDNAETLLQLAVLGLGIIRLADVIVGAEIARGSLLPILTDSHHAEPVPLYAVYPPGRHRSPRVAAMVDFLLENFAHAPWRAAACAGTAPDVG